MGLNTLTDPQANQCETKPLAAGCAQGPCNRILVLLIILAVCAGVRIWLIHHTEVITSDGIVYVHAAQSWKADPGYMMRVYDIHPGYPGAMSCIYDLLGAFGRGPGALRWELAGQIVALAASIAALAALWVFAGVAFDWRIAWITTLLFGLARKWAELGADVLTDPLALCFEMWAFVLALLAARQMKQGRARAVGLSAAAGACMAAAYLVRPEGFLVYIPVAALWLACAARRKATWKLALASSAAALAMLLALSLPYMITIGTFTKRWPIEEYLKLAGAQGPFLACAATGWADKAGSILQIVPKLMERMHPVLAVAACVWLLTWALVRLGVKLPSRIHIFPDYPAAFLMVGWAITFTPLVIVRNLRHTMSGRYMLLQAALLAPLAAAGVMILVQWVVIIMERRTARLELVRRLATALIVGAMAAGLAWHSLRPTHEGHAYLRQAGLWLADTDNTRPDDYIFTTKLQVLIYTERKGSRLQDAALADRRTFLEHIADTKEIAESTEAYIAVSHQDIAEDWLVPPVFHQKEQFPQVGKDGDVIHVYRIDMAALRRARRKQPTSSGN